MNQRKKAVVLLSGGLDSATCLAYAKHHGFECYALSFDYQQRHASELEAAKAIADDFSIAQHVIFPSPVNLFGHSALTDMSISVPDYEKTDGIPITYVPARNLIFLSFATGLAEVVQAYDIFIGVNAIDYSNYPDCRPEFISAFEHAAQLATRRGVEDEQKLKIGNPLQNLNKAEIIKLGTELGVDYAKTISCYQANETGQACGRCDSCELRRQGFADAGIPDPTLYV